ncbi:hypothetical protein LINPERHAP1_LOCUS11740 [Linum perenne]
MQNQPTSITQMHSKIDSPPPRRPAAYYVQSPTNHDAAEKIWYDDVGSTPLGAPSLHYSHEFSAWKHVKLIEDNDDDEIHHLGRRNDAVRIYLWGLCFFCLAFTLFCFILWGTSRSYKPQISVKEIVFKDFNVQAGYDYSGVVTDMLTLNSTVKIQYWNPGTFFSVHVSSTPLELHYFQLKLASGKMREFSQMRKSGRTVATIVKAHQVPLYGGNIGRVTLPLSLSFTVRSRADIMGRLVRSVFYSHVRCQLTLRGNKLGKVYNLTQSCVYD